MTKQELNKMLDEAKQDSAFFSKWNELDKAIAVLLGVSFVLIATIAGLAIATM